jgi:hypothetical protein
MGGKRECQFRGPAGERCTLHTKNLGQPATYPPNGCSVCEKQTKRCKAHCFCVEQATGRSAPRTNVFSAAAGNLAAPAAAFASSSGLGKAAPAVPRPRSRSPARVAAVAAALNAADARGLASAEEESRRHERHVMEKPFLRQWRGLTLADRPLPPPGYADSGLVCDGVWSDGLKGAAKERTVELLKSERWKTTREHSSVRLTLYLRWAEDRLRQRSAERIAGLDLGRHIQGLL